MRFRLSLEELKSKVDIALKNNDLFADLKDVKIELRLSVGGPSRVSYHGNKLGSRQKMVFWLTCLCPVIYVIIYAGWFFLLLYPFYTSLSPYLIFAQFALFLFGLLLAFNLTFINPRARNKKDENTFFLTMPSSSFLYLAPFQMEESLLHELQHIRQQVRDCPPSEKEADRIAKELLPIYLARVQERKA